MLGEEEEHARGVDHPTDRLASYVSPAVPPTTHVTTPVTIAASDSSAPAPATKRATIVAPGSSGPASAKKRVTIAEPASSAPAPELQYTQSGLQSPSPPQPQPHMPLHSYTAPPQPVLPLPSPQAAVQPLQPPAQNAQTTNLTLPPPLPPEPVDAAEDLIPVESGLDTIASQQTDDPPAEGGSIEDLMAAVARLEEQGRLVEASALMARGLR